MSLKQHAFRVKGKHANSREQETLCNRCKVLAYGMCPNLIALHDSGYIDPPVKVFLWKDFYDKTFDMLKDEAVHSANAVKRKKK